MTNSRSSSMLMSPEREGSADVDRQRVTDTGRRDACQRDPAALLAGEARPVPDLGEDLVDHHLHERPLHLRRREPAHLGEHLYPLRAAGWVDGRVAQGASHDRSCSPDDGRRLAVRAALGKVLRGPAGELGEDRLQRRAGVSEPVAHAGRPGVGHRALDETGLGKLGQPVGEDRIGDRADDADAARRTRSRRGSGCRG